MPMKFLIKQLIVTALLFFVVACNSPESNELKQDNLRADSLSIKLNSPELKAINAKLLEDPSSSALYNSRAQIYLNLRQFKEAINDAKRAIKLDSTVVDYYHTLTDVYFSENSTRLAKDLLEIIERKFPDNTAAMLKLAEIYFLVKQYQKSIDYANKALKIDENIAKAYYIKGSVYRESGDTAKAISSLETVLEQDNKNEDAFYDLGVMFAARKNSLALDYYKNALQINPNNTNTLYALAKFLQDIGKTDEAIAQYESILKLDKQCKTCCYNLGAIYVEIKKDYKKALEYFTKAIEINSNYLEAYFARGYTYTKLKDKESAKADYSMCLKLQPNYEAAVEAMNEM